MAFLVFLLEIRLRKLVDEREKMIDQVQTKITHSVPGG
jgi:hypothetical protein